ncbi:MAG: hypothetical protein IJR54_08990 [Oscillibacter sp.]|nr:hypothetical protein [Oscillibacter sp.]
MNSKRNEVSYYPEIRRFIEAQLKSNFRAAKRRTLYVFWGIGELKTNLERISREHPEACACARTFARTVPPLNLDIFALVTDSRKFELLILEVKRMDSAGLKEWSQLVGYCLVSGAKYGLLVNVDHGASSRLSDILAMEEHLSRIRTLVGGTPREHCLGFMQWDSLTQDFGYSSLGALKSLSDLSGRLIADFS